MGVVADEVWDEWESYGREHDSIDVVVRSSLPPEEAYQRVRAAFDAAWPDPQDWPAEIIISPTVHGAALNIVNCEELTDVLLPMIGQFAGAGVRDPRIELFPEEPMRLLHAGTTAFLECRLAVRAEYLPAPQPWKRHWQIDEALLQDIYKRAAQWCLDLPHRPRTTYIFAGMESYPVPEGDASHWLAEAARALDPLETVELIVEAADGAFRMTSLCPASAHLSLADGALTAAGFDWTQSLAALRGAVEQFAGAWARTGFIKRGSHWLHVGPPTFSGGHWVPIPHTAPTYFPYQREVEEDGILDACGVLILDRDAADRVPQTWRVEPLGSRHVLAQHPDLAAWFTAEHPDQQTLDTTRAELRALLPPQNPPADATSAEA
jgi:hypothetical protein